MEIPDDFDGQQHLLLAAAEVMLTAAKYCAGEAINRENEGDLVRAREYMEYYTRNKAAYAALRAVALTYDLPLWDVDE